MITMGYSFVVDRVRESKETSAVNVRNIIGRGILTEIEQGVRMYLGLDSTAYDGEPLILFQHPERKMFLAILRDGDEELIYAFLGSDGRALPDIECYGEVAGKQEAVQEFSSMLSRGFILIEDHPLY